MEADWAKIRSYHAVRTFTRGIGMAISLCGRTLRGPYVKELPMGDRSCESCLRILANRA